jgi:coenzyme PQQ precursor peptide PqqA
LRSTRVLAGAMKSIIIFVAQPNSRSFTMWTKPAASDLRFGFEVTMYIAAR